jgi:hypothetical protein
MSEYISRWKPVGDDTDDIEKMKVVGGWLFRTRVTSGGEQLLVTSVAMAFVPDPTPPKKETVRIKRRR